MYKLEGAGRWELLRLNQRIVLKEKFYPQGGMEGVVSIGTLTVTTNGPKNLYKWIPTTSISNFLKSLEYNSPNLQKSTTAEMFLTWSIFNVLLQLVRNVYNWRHNFADCDLFYIQVFYIFYDLKEFLSWFNFKSML